MIEIRHRSVLDPLLWLATFLAVLAVSRSAGATCSYQCTTELVDASCNVLPAAQVSGDAVRVHMKCDEECCGGGTNCTTTPVTVTPDQLVLSPKPASGSFSAHPTCPSVFVFGDCLPDGNYAVGYLGTYFGSMSFQVTGNACPAPANDAGADGGGAGGAPSSEESEEDGGCSLSSRWPVHSGWRSTLLVLFVLGSLLVRRSRKAGVDHS